MSDEISIDKVDESSMYIHADESIIRDMWDYFSFRAKDYQFMPKYQAGIWDGYIRLLNYHDQTMPIGLIHDVIKYARDEKLKLDIDPDIHLARKDDPCPVDVEGLMESFNLPFEPHDYQIDAVKVILKHRKRLILSPTSSGKSFIIYSAIRALLDTGKRVLVVVPTTSLVEQMVGDFAEYSENNDFDAHKTCHMIYTGKEKSNKSPVTVTTWQSVYKKRGKWFEGFDAVFVDEAHLASAESITGIMSKCGNAEYRIGLTGTIEDAESHKYTLVGQFGRVYETITTRELMDRDIVSDLLITAVVFDHGDADRKYVAGLNYEDEIDYIISNEKKNRFICKLALTQHEQDNTLVLFRYKERHGVPLFELMKELNTSGKKVFYVDGDTPVAEREAIRKYTESNHGVVIIASYGTFSTGINIKNLQNVIFAHPMKSKIKILQSIGRVLRKSKFSNKAKLYDIVCDFKWKSKENSTLKHFKERFKQYKKAQFKCITKVVRI